jgi:hypothetical protein
MATLFQRTATADSIPPVPGLRYRRRERHLLEPRSLPVLCDTARHNWKHRIAPRKTDLWHGLRMDRRRRQSVTFRSRAAGPGL